MILLISYLGTKQITAVCARVHHNDPDTSVSTKQLQSYQFKVAAVLNTSFVTKDFIDLCSTRDVVLWCSFLHNYPSIITHLDTSVRLWIYVGSCAFTRANGWLRFDQTVTCSRARTLHAWARACIIRDIVFGNSCRDRTLLPFVSSVVHRGSPVGLIAQTGDQSKRAKEETCCGLCIAIYTTLR